MLFYMSHCYNNSPFIYNLEKFPKNRNKFIEIKNNQLLILEK